MSSPISDDTLLSRFRKGDVEALGQLYQRYIELVYGVCLRYLRSEADAEDATMSIYEQMAKKVVDHEIRDFRPWLYVLAKNFCLMELRRQKRKITIPLEPDSVQISQVQHPWNEMEMDKAQLEKSLYGCLEELPIPQRRCLELFYFEENSYKDIAKAQKQAIGWVRSQLQNGRRNLRNCVEDQQLKE